MEPSATTNEIGETESLLKLATYEGVRKLLSDHLVNLKSKKSESESDVSMEIAEEVVPSKLTSVAPPNPPRPPAASAGAKYVPIEDIAWDQGEYNSANITIYVDLPFVGSAKDRVKVSFGQYSFDLVVEDLNGKNYRVLKDNLEKDIIPEESSFKVKANKVVIKLRKKKGEYSYESWTHLTAKKKRETGDQAKKKADPMGGIMEMMQNMYEEGDDQTRKVIGEAMMKSRSGEKSMDPLNDMPPMDDGI